MPSSDILQCFGDTAAHANAPIQASLSNVINKIKGDEEIKVLKTDVSETTKIKEIWSTFTEFELEFKSIRALLDFSFDYTPSLIEIINPEKLELDSIEVTNFLNDLLARLHQYTMAVTSLNSENKILKLKLNEYDKKNK